VWDLREPPARIYQEALEGPVASETRLAA
jgi:hypothetical protein